MWEGREVIEFLTGREANISALTSNFVGSGAIESK
jgi:hypothetical protein